MAVSAGLAATAQSLAQPAVLPSPLRPVAGSIPGLTVALQLDQDLYAGLKGVGRAQLGGFLLDAHRTVDLSVERFDVPAPDARLILAEWTGAAAREVEMAPPDVILLRGQVVGQPGSTVFLSLSPHGSHGYIRLDDDAHGAQQTYIISTPAEVAMAGGPTVIYNLSTLPAGVIEWQQFTCDARQIAGREWREADHSALHSGNGAGDGPDTLPCRRVRIAIETDWEYMTRFGGNSAAAQAYIHTLMGALTEIYTRDVNTRFEVVYSRIWSTSGDPWTATTIDSRLNEFRAHWNSTMQGVNRNIAHMLSGLRNGSGGVAWVGVLCSSPESYGISGYIDGSFPYPLINNHSQNWDVIVVAHEIAHNFSAPHTHEMIPPIDQCGSGTCAGAHLGTLMSYCHICAGGLSNISLDLHPRIVIEKIVPYLNSLACNVLVAPINILQFPSMRTVVSGQSTQFAAQATGPGPLTYQWLHNGIDLKDGRGISGANTATLSIAPAEAHHAGDYAVRITNSCGPVTSTHATLTVLPPCYADCDHSTTVPRLNVDDFSCFINSFSSAQQLPITEQITHYANCDGSTNAPVLNVDDFVCFLAQFSAGCP